MNKIQLSGKVFKLQRRENMTTFDLMFYYDKQTKKGKFIKVKAFKEAHDFMREGQEYHFIELEGWLDKEEYINQEGKKVSNTIVCTKQINEKTMTTRNNSDNTEDDIDF